MTSEALASDSATSTRPRLAAIYARISNDARGDGEGVERQEADCRELAEKLGLSVVQIYSDNDIGASSATSDKKVRHAYNALLADARAGKFGVILAYSNSRITRRVREYMELIDLYRDFGVVIRTVKSGDHDLSTADGRAVALTLATWDAAEAERTGERVKRAHLHRAYQGRAKPQGQRPIGFEQDGVTHVPDEVAAIREAVALVIGGSSLRSIKRLWEEREYKTSSGKEVWTFGTIRQILTSWRTCGVREYLGEPLKHPDGTWVMGQWEPIISIEEHDLLIAVLDKRKKEKVRQGKWMLTGLVRCGECGGKMYGQLGHQTTRELSTYSCQTNRSHASIAAGRLEDYVVLEVRAYRIAREIFGEAAEPKPKVREPWGKTKELTQAETQYAEAQEAWKAGHLKSRDAFPLFNQLGNTIEELKKDRLAYEAEEVLSRPRATVNNPQPAFDGELLSPDHPDAEAVRAELDYIVIQKGVRGHGGRLARNFAKRIELEWKEPHIEYGAREELSEEEQEAEYAAMDARWNQKLADMRLLRKLADEARDEALEASLGSAATVAQAEEVSEHLDRVTSEMQNASEELEVADVDHQVDH